MAKVYAMIADGTEEVECLAVVDLLRRSKIDTVLVAAKEDREVVTSHGIRIQADAAVGGLFRCRCDFACGRNARLRSSFPV